MRMEKGEAPNDDIEKEWMKKLRDQAKKTTGERSSADRK